MKGVYAVEKKNGISVSIGYTPPGEPRVREVSEFVREGAAYSKRVREARKRAEDVLHKRLAAIAEGRHGIVRPKPSITFERFVQKHYLAELEERDPPMRSIRDERHRLTRGPLAQFLGNLTLKRIDRWQIQRFIKARREGAVGSRPVGPAIINRDLQRLRNLWNAAEQRGLVTGRNPVTEVGLLHEPNRRVRYLADDEEARLLAACKPYLRRIVEFALHTGIRKGAILGLRWRDVDLDTGSICVPEDLSKSREPYFVPMNATVRELLIEQLEQARERTGEACVFATRSGERRRSIDGAWTGALRRTGIQNFRFHDLRHTTASRIVMGGGSLYDAGTFLGHRTRQMAERYAHLSPEHLRAVADLTLRREAAPVISIDRQRDAL